MHDSRLRRFPGFISGSSLLLTLPVVATCPDLESSQVKSIRDHSISRILFVAVWVSDRVEHTAHPHTHARHRDRAAGVTGADGAAIPYPLAFNERYIRMHTRGAIVLFSSSCLARETGRQRHTRTGVQTRGHSRRRGPRRHGSKSWQSAPNQVHRSRYSGSRPGRRPGPSSA